MALLYYLSVRHYRNTNTNNPKKQVFNRVSNPKMFLSIMGYEWDGGKINISEKTGEMFLQFSS